MNKKESFIKVRDELKKYNEEYYNSKPSIDDSKYDNLKKKINFQIPEMLPQDLFAKLIVKSLKIDL